MSFQVGASCFDTAESAAAASAAALSGVVVTRGSATYRLEVVSLGADQRYDWILVGGSGANFSMTITPSFPACSLLDTSDAFELSGLILAVWVAAFSVVMLRRPV